MNGVVKVFTILAGIGLVTTMILPDRQTPAVIDSIRKLIQGSFGTVMGLSSVPTVK
jgi:hypothetical protein